MISKITDAMPGVFFFIACCWILAFTGIVAYQAMPSARAFKACLVELTR